MKRTVPRLTPTTGSGHRHSAHHLFDAHPRPRLVEAPVAFVKNDA